MRTKKRPPYREAIIHVVKDIGAGVQFTQNDAWERLPERMKERLASFYDETTEEGDLMETVRKRFHNNLTVSSHQTHNGALAGLTKVKTHSGGRSLFVWVPPTVEEKKADPRTAVGTRRVFTVAGYTEDGDTIYRDDDGNLGWFDWKTI